MVSDHLEKAAERLWKHRFAQTLFEAFCIRGVGRSHALDDAYAHADAQYLVRSLNGPEDEARAALNWIFADTPQSHAGITDGATPPANQHNGAHHIESIQITAPDPDLPE